MVKYPYPINSIVNCGKRSFIIRGWDGVIRVHLYTNGGYQESVLRPILSRPIINGVMQKGGHAQDCEKELIARGLAKLEADNEMVL